MTKAVDRILAFHSTRSFPFGSLQDAEKDAREQYRLVLQGILAVVIFPCVGVVYAFHKVAAVGVYC